MAGKTLTLEEFREIGTEMSFLHNRLTLLYVKVTHGNCKARASSKLLNESLKKFDKACSQLEELMFEQFGDQPGSDTKVFYGNTALPADIKIIEK